MNLGKHHAGYWRIYTVSFGIWITGALWLLLHYLFVQHGEFGPAPSPLEHASLVAHGAAAFASVWLLGSLWDAHVVTRWRLRHHRKSGGLLSGVMCLLTVSGYLLYYLSGDAARTFTAYLHWIIGLAMPLTLLAHWLIRRR